MKGISPLLGAVFVIGITIALAIAISSWSKSFITSEARKTAEHAGIECSYVNIGVYKAEYDENTRKLLLELGAAGTVSVKIDKIIITNKTYHKAKYINGVNISIPLLEPGEKEYVYLLNVIPNFTTIRIIPYKCPMKAVEISFHEVIVK